MSEPRAPLNPALVADLLRAAAAAFQAELAALPPALTRFHPAPGEWCAREVLGHLIEAEQRGFDGRIRLMLEADEPALEAWDQAEVARARGDCEREPAGLLREFAERRAASVALVARLTEADLVRGGLHPKVGRLRVSDLLHEWVHHDRNHLRQIMAAVQAYVWPAMGNAQRFSLP